LAKDTGKGQKIGGNGEIDRERGPEFWGFERAWESPFKRLGKTAIQPHNLGRPDATSS
jgi:hypothetical protein